MPITKDQARIYELLANVLAKLFLVAVCGAVLIAVTVKLILAPSWPVGLVESVLAGTVYKAYSHFFPTRP